MTVTGPLLTLLVCAYALWRGGLPERIAAVGGVAVLLGAMVAQAITGSASVWPVISADLIISAGLLVLAVIWGRAWTLAAIAVAAGLLLVHSLLLEDGAAPTPLYNALVNAFTVALLTTLAGGVRAAHRARSRATATALA